MQKKLFFGSKKNNNDKFKIDNIKKIDTTSLFETNSAAYGLSFVLETLISKSLSKKSFTTHPIVLENITPKRNTKLIEL